MTAAQKSTEAFRTISEAANELDVPQHVLRFWETKFSQIKPMKRGGGRRYYRPADIDLLKGIRKLLYEDGFTIKGVQKVLRERGVRFVMDAGTLSAQAQTAAAEIAAPSLVAQEASAIVDVSEPEITVETAPVREKAPETAPETAPEPSAVEPVQAEPVAASVAKAESAPTEHSKPEAPKQAAPAAPAASAPAAPEVSAQAAPPIPTPATAKVAPSVSKQLDMAVAAVMQGIGPSPLLRPPSQPDAEAAAKVPAAKTPPPAHEEQTIAAQTPTEPETVEAPVPSSAAAPTPAPTSASTPTLTAPSIDSDALKPSFAAAQGFVLSSTSQPTATDVQFSPDQSVTFKPIATPDNDDTVDSPILEMAKDGVTDEQRRQLEDILIKLEGLKDEIDRTMASLAVDNTAATPDAAKRAQWQSRASNENREGEAGTEVSNSGERKAEAG